MAARFLEDERRDSVMGLTAPTAVQLISIGRYLNIYIGSLMLLAGLMGALINMWLFSRQRFRKSPCSRFILVSSLFDFTHLIAALLFRILADGFNIDPASTSIIGCRIRYYLITFSAYASVGCRCLAAFDRYACTSRSILFRQWSSFGIAHRLLLVNTLLWACFAMPNFAFFNLVSIHATRRFCYIANETYAKYFAYFVNPVLYFALPLVILISYAIKTHQNLELMKRTRQIRRLERQMTSMIILQALTNSISSIPYGIEFFYSAITRNVYKDEYRRAQEHLFLQITRLSYYINFISAFYIYFISCRQIRSTIRSHMFKRHDNSSRENFLLLDLSKSSSTRKKKLLPKKLLSASDVEQ